MPSNLYRFNNHEILSTKSVVSASCKASAFLIRTRERKRFAKIIKRPFGITADTAELCIDL